MKRIVLLLSISVLATLILGWVNLAEAQQAKKKVPRIGFLYSGSLSDVARSLDACRQGLLELGYVEGKNISFEYRYAEGKLDRLLELATELVRLKVDVIVAGYGNRATMSAKRATTTIPIVMVIVINPAGSGRLVASLSRPGGNVTGLSLDVRPEQAGKQLELLKEAVPKISRVAILRNPNSRSHVAASKAADKVAKSLQLTVRFAYVQARNDKGLEDALGAVVNERANALLVLPWAFFVQRRQQIVSFTARNKLPEIYWRNDFVEAGGLMSYGASTVDQWRRSATYVDRILKGAKPGDLPVEQPRKFELIINLKTAKQIGVTIPREMLFRADKVIK